MIECGDSVFIIIFIFIISGDVDDVFLPSPSDLLANLSNCREQVVSMLTGDFPNIFTLIATVYSFSLSQHSSKHAQKMSLKKVVYMNMIIFKNSIQDRKYIIILWKDENKRHSKEIC